MECNQYSGFYLIMLLCFVMNCWVHFGPTAGYLVINCTINGSLNDNNRPKVFCDKRKLQTVPLFIPHNTEVFDISFNYISQVKTGDIKYLKFLKILNMSNNLISCVEQGAFKDLVILQDLSLAMNRLTRISENFFQGLVNLKTLRIDGNFITSMDSSTFYTLSNLKLLNLTSNQLQHIEKVQPIFKLPRLEELYIGSNLFSSFQPKDMLNTSFRLRFLDLSWNPLKIFQITESTLPRLEGLDLSYTVPNGTMVWDVPEQSILSNVNRLNMSGIYISEGQIVSVFRSFNSSLENLFLNNMDGMKMDTLLKYACMIPTLRILHLRGNNLTFLMEQMFQPCPQVIELDLIDNKLCSLFHFTFRPIRFLTTLHLSHNQFNHVPTALRDLHILEFLDLSYNQIMNLSCWDFNNLTRLKHLNLFHNCIYKLKACFFSNLLSLNTLILRGNKILTILDAFTNLQNLERLELGANKLSCINEGDFKGLYSLKHLDLTDNQISVIEENAFLKLIKLTNLFLSSNKISENTISSKVFGGMPKLQVLSLDSNYISYENYDKLESPPFTQLKSLIYLKIGSQAHKGLRNIPCNFLEGLESLKSIKAENLNIDCLHPDTFVHTPHLNSLDISKNVFTTLNPEVFQRIQELKELTLSNGRLNSLDFLSQTNLTQLWYLQASQNELAVINKTLIQSLPSLSFLNLKENAFTCDCSNAWFVRWMESNNATQVVDANDFNCNYPPNLRGTKLSDLDIESCIVDLGFYYYVGSTLMVLITLLVFFFNQYLHWKVVCIYYLLHALIYDYKKRKCQTLQYDAFISYTSKDELWVMKELLPQLEEKQGWRLCLHHRDFQPGRPIMDNIVDGIYSSRKTICLISQHYLESEWCSQEIQVASFRLFDEKKDVLVLVFLEDIPVHLLSPYHRMRKLVKKRTFLRWPKPGEDTRVFWYKLRVALEAGEDLNEDSPILSTIEHERL